jgi:RNA polymerase sigma-70 factor (ECF subfamily)
MLNSLEPIWEQFNTRLRRFIRRRVEDDAAAEDILQEVFLRIHTRMETLSDSSRLESWIFQIARNAVIDHYRRRRDLVEIPETIPAEDDFGEPDAAAILAASLREMVEALPEPYRQALLLTEYEGLTQAELAERLGISLSGAKSRVQRARQRIKDGLLACCHFEFDRYGRVIDYWEHCCCCAGEGPAKLIFLEDII